MISRIYNPGVLIDDVQLSILAALLLKVVYHRSDLTEEDLSTLREFLTIFKSYLS